MEFHAAVDGRTAAEKTSACSTNPPSPVADNSVTGTSIHLDCVAVEVSGMAPTT
jgi:hypothetical protein